MKTDASETELSEIDTSETEHTEADPSAITSSERIILKALRTQ